MYENEKSLGHALHPIALDLKFFSDLSSPLAYHIGGILEFVANLVDMRIGWIRQISSVHKLEHYVLRSAFITELEPWMTSVIAVVGKRCGSSYRSATNQDVLWLSLLRFSYDSNWTADQEAFPLSLALPLHDDAYTGKVVHPFLKI